jgi:hypothetical protein
MSLEGMDEALSKLAKMLGPRATESAIKGLKLAAHDLAGRAQQLAPHDKGPLSDSIRPDDLRVGFDGISIAVGSDKPYARVQHENLAFQHSPGRQAKYLEQPLTQNEQRYKEFVARAIREGLGP